LSGFNMIVDLEDQTIPGLMRRSFSLYRSFPALASVDETAITYDGLSRRIEMLSRQLGERGITRGQRIALLGENCPNWVIAYLAATSIGAVVVPILPGFPDQDVRHIIRHSECTAVFASRRQRPKLEGAELPGVQAVFLLDDLSCAEEKGHPPEIAEGVEHRPVRDGGGGHVPPGAEDTRGPSPEDTAAIIYTSGTTGHSKGVMLTHRNIVSDAVGSIERFPIDSGDRFLSVLPLSHAYEATGGMLCPLAVGASVFYMRGLPAPTRLLSAMQTVKPTAVLMVPLILDAIYRKRVLAAIKARRLDWLCRFWIVRRIINRAAGRKLIASLGGHLRFFMLGGASLNEDLEIFLRDAGIGYSTGYGMTEASPILTINPSRDVRLGSCGKPIPGVEVRIHEPDAATGIGEILVRGPNIMEGYFKNDEATSSAFVEGRWLRTGDLGRVDDEGYLYIMGRSKNVIVGPSGENIYPEIVEQHLLKSAYIVQAICYQRDERLVARVNIDQDLIDQEFDSPGLSEPAAGELLRNLLEGVRTETNKCLPGFSAIQKIEVEPEPFQLTPTNKVKRYLYTK
jgi:long-chain acyl-CoA synthetase